MIIKSFEINKKIKNLLSINIYLIYGENIGLKKDIRETIVNAKNKEKSEIISFYENDIFYRDTCTLMYFNYKTTKKIVYKKKILDNGNIRMIEKDDGFNPPDEMMEEGNFEKIEKNEAFFNKIKYN